MEVMLIGLGGALGASLRYLLGQLLRSRSFPWSTLVVNVLGSFLLGVVLISGANEAFVLFVGVGFCGAFTTFSSFSFQTIELWERGHRLRAVANAVGNLLLALSGYVIAWVVVG